MAGRLGTTLITVVSSQTRVDLSLPSHATVLDLMPAVLRLSRVDAGGADWLVGRLGEAPFPGTTTLDDERVLDGEILHLRAGTEPVRPPLYTEPADAVAATGAGRSRWGRGETALLWVSTVYAVMALLTIVLFRLSPMDGVRAASLAFVTLTASALVLTRHSADRRLVIAVGDGACGAAVVAGARLPSTPFGPTTVLSAGTALLVAALIMATLVNAGRERSFGIAFGTGPVVICLGVGVAVAVPFGADLAGLIVVATFLAPAALPLALRISGIVGAALHSANGSVTAATELAERVAVGQRFTVAAGAASSGAASIAAVVLPMVDDRSWSWALSGTVLAALAIGSGGQVWRATRCAVLLPTGSAALVLLAVAILRATPAVLGAIAGALLIAMGALIVAVARIHHPHRQFPATGHWLDRTRALLLCAAVPLALAVMDVYSLVRHA